MRLPDAPGTYLLWLPCTLKASCKIGRLGTLTLQPGWYAYVGSALGPGGLAARLRHHLQQTPRPRWHIDYLRQRLAVRRIWFICNPIRLEHQWAEALAALPSTHPPRPGFGSSDCRCPSHLFFMADALPLETGREILRLRGIDEIQAVRQPEPESNDRYG